MRGADMSRKKEKAAAKQRQTTRQLIGIEEITERSLRTGHGELAYFIIKPPNLSTHSPEAVGARIYALLTVLKGIEEVEMLALNSRESFEDNKRYYRQRAEEETMPLLSRLLELDAASLDRLQVQMATAREFFVMIRFKQEKETEIQSYLVSIQKSLEDQGFFSRLATGEDMKRTLGVYFEQNATTEKYENFDGERWVILGE